MTRLDLLDEPGLVVARVWSDRGTSTARSGGDDEGVEGTRVAHHEDAEGRAGHGVTLERRREAGASEDEFG